MRAGAREGGGRTSSSGDDLNPTQAAPEEPHPVCAPGSDCRSPGPGKPESLPGEFQG